MGLFNAYVALSGSGGIDVERDVALSKHTSYRIGGPADLLATCHDLSALMRCISVLEREGIEWTVLGKGTNVLVSDEGYRGCIIKLGTEFSRIDSLSDDEIVAGGGASLAKVVTAALERSLSGLEELVGIPGTVGGAIAMNAGSRTSWIGSRVSSVVVLRPGDGLHRYNAQEIQWGYRQTSIPPNEIVLEASLLLEPGEGKEIARLMQAYLASRRRTQPIGRATCGSVFKNPGERSTGLLVQSLGLKKFEIGGARVSSAHANFIVNMGDATAKDVIAVMTHVHDRVLEEHGIDLEPEVRLLGF